MGVGVAGLTVNSLLEILGGGSHGSSQGPQEVIRCRVVRGLRIEKRTREVGMSAIVHEERRKPGGSLLRVVVCQFQGGKVKVPVVMLFVDVGTKHLLDGTVGSFRLTVSLRMERRRHEGLDSHRVKER